MVESHVVKKASRLRIAIPQIVAVSAKNLILFDLGLCIAFPTIVIPAVQNSPGDLSLDDEQTSWFGSIPMICTPVGSVLSGLILERLGRKLSLIVVNIPLLVSWLLYYFVSSPASLLATSALMGFSSGFVQAPVLTYVAEVSEPHLRGVLISYSEVCLTVGMFCQYLIGTITDWRTSAAISAALPIISIAAITQIPESPAWLVSRGRSKQAEKSLCWLRGWVKPDLVKTELVELERYYSSATPDILGDCLDDKKVAGTEDRSDYNSLRVTLREMLRAETMRPLVMVTAMSVLEHWGGVTGTRPYMVQVFNELGLPIDAHWATVVTGLLSICGVVVFLISVPWCGKRPLLFLSVTGVVACCTLIGVYSYLVLPATQDNNWMPLALYITLFFTHSLALNPLPWILLSEVFPFRTRSLAGGTAAAINYVIQFVASKTFLSLKTQLGLYGVYWMYAGITALGAVYLSFVFNETEGKSLQDIEEYYKTKSAPPSGKTLSVAQPEEAARDERRSEEGAAKCHSQECRPMTRTDIADEASGDRRLPLWNLEGSSSPRSEEAVEMVSSTRETEDDHDGGCPGQLTDSSQHDVAVVSGENEELQKIGQSAVEVPPSAGKSSSAASDAEDTTPTSCNGVHLRKDADDGHR